LLFFCIAFSTDSFSQPITIASPISIPPYVFSDSDTGIQLDIVRESLTIAGHSLKVMYASNNRGLNFLKAKVADGMINVPAGVPDLYYSASTIEYQNGVLALKSRKLVLSDVSDLQTLRIVGFQNASNYFGSEFKQLTQSNKNYDEVVNQLAQLNMLFKRRCDVVVMDHRIFNFHLNNNKTESGFDQETVFYNILPPSPRYVAFHNKALRDSFDKGLKELKASGRHQAIINSYLR
jgi:polar amino acid transport system substrate-binding protein